MDKRKILVWDLPTRAVHWLLAASFTGAFLTADSDRLLGVHITLGYTMVGLLAFRVLWGVMGTRYARFSSFAFGPRRVASYLKSVLAFSPQHYVGHNPAGGWAIYALFALALLASVSGYASNAGIGSDWIGDAHEAVANTFLAVVLVHIAGVIVSSLMHRENLVRAMVSGYKSGNPKDAIRYKHRAVALVLVLAVAGFWMSGSGSGPSPGSGAQAAAARHGAADEHRN